MTNQRNETDTLIDRTVVDGSGDKIGKVEDIYFDDATGRPEWLAVKTGMFGGKSNFVPLEGAEREGDDIVVPYGKSVVKDAPKIDEDGHLSPEDEAELYQYYNRDWSEQEHADRSGDGKKGDGRSGGAMTRSEETLDIQKRRETTGRARLRKWVETEDAHITVPVRREKARVVTEPVTDKNRGDATSGQPIKEDEHEIVLEEEVVDVDKHVEPRERVRLEKETETDEVTVDEQVRKERIGMDERNASRRDRS